MAYTVYFTGEYDLDDEGYPYTRRKEFATYDEAKEALLDYKRETGNIGTMIERS